MNTQSDQLFVVLTECQASASPFKAAARVRIPLGAPSAIEATWGQETSR
jgi:hypothetical protein